MLYIQKGYLRTVVEPGRVEYSTASGEIVRAININEGPISYVDTVTTTKGKPIPDPLEEQILLAAGKTFIPDALMDDEAKIHVGCNTTKRNRKFIKTLNSRVRKGKATEKQSKLMTGV